MGTTPRGFRDISTTYQLAYVTTDGNVQVRKIGERLWEILSPERVAVYESAKKAALQQARKLAGSSTKRRVGTRGVRRVKRKVRR